jgi:hypothetical protein
MLVRRMLAVVDHHVRPRRRDAAALDPLEPHGVAVDAEAAERGEHGIGVRAGVDERGEQHVAGHPRRAVDVRDPGHRSIRATAHAAP